MLKHKLFDLKLVGHRLSVRAAAFAVFAVKSFLAAVLFDDYVTDDVGNLVGNRPLICKLSEL